MINRHESPPMNTPTPDLSPTAAPRGEVIRARISHYNPALGGVNCSNFVNGQCLSRMASGARWERWVDKACACPAQFQFGTRFILPDGSEWTCMDRGGKIVTEPGGAVWLDLLTSHTKYTYGQVVTVEVLR
jgi:hypothetical protein